MKKQRFLLSLLCTVFITGCTTSQVGTPTANELKPFKTDGCSLFPDGTFKDKNKWREDCIEHDISYWQGGTEEDRRNADLQLKHGILSKTGDKHLAKMVYDTVRTWGSPIFPSWYRWGYGWKYGRGYKELTMGEREQVEKRLQEFYYGQLSD